MVEFTLLVFLLVCLAYGWVWLLRALREEQNRQRFAVKMRKWWGQ